MQVTSEIDDRKQTEKLALIDVVDQADVQLAVIEASPGRDLHAAAVGPGVGKGGKENGDAASGGSGRRVAVPDCDLGTNRRVVAERRQQAERIAAIPPQPARQSIRPPRHLARQTNPRDG